MFTEKIDTLLETIGASNTDIAKEIGCNASLVSRLRTGARSPKRESKTIDKFAYGVYAFAKDKNLIPFLITMVDAQGEDEIQIEKAIKEWIYEDENLVRDKKSVVLPVKKEGTENGTFAQKLDLIMNILELSNIRLAKAINLDPSQISRFRTGTRVPKTNQATMYDICKYLYEKLINGGYNEELSELVGQKADIFEKPEGFECFSEWMSQIVKNDSDDLIENFLDEIDNYREVRFSEEMEKIHATIIEKAYAEKRRIYHGIAECREGFLNVLAYAEVMKVPTVYLYTDFHASILYSDPSYAEKWKIMMKKCIANGTEFKIAFYVSHVIDYTPDIIKHWIPFFVKGKIHAYVSNMNYSPLVSNFMLVIPDRTTMGSHVFRGKESDMIYCFENDPAIVKCDQEIIEEIIYKYSESLFEIYPDKADEKVVDIIKEDSMLYSVMKRLSTSSMPEDLVNEVIDRVAPEDEETRTETLKHWKMWRDVIANISLRGKTYEYVQEVSDEALFSEKIDVALFPLSERYKTKYMPEEYGRHMKNIIRKLDNDSRFHFYQIADGAFENMELLVTDKHAIIIRLTEPKLTFVIKNQIVLGFIKDYVIDKLDHFSMNRREERQKLLKYLI